MRCVTVRADGVVVLDPAPPSDPLQCELILVSGSEWGSPDLGTLGFTPADFGVSVAWSFGAVLGMWALGFAFSSTLGAIKRA